MPDTSISKPLQLQRSQNNNQNVRNFDKKDLSVPHTNRNNDKVVNIKIKTFDPYKMSYQAINPKLKGEYLTFLEKGRNDEYKFVIINTKVCREIRSDKPI
jgi:uncharacterized protein YgiM (DUF1202 family)